MPLPLADILVQILGDMLLGGSSKPPQPAPPEGMVNASLGAIAAFLGILSALLAILASLNAVAGHPFTGLFLCLIVAGLASGGIATGGKAPRVTTRNLGLARLGFGAAAFALVVSLLGLVVAFIRVLV